MGGRRSRYWCGPGSVRAYQNGARLSESGIGALQIEKLHVALTIFVVGVGFRLYPSTPTTKIVSAA